MHKKLHFTVSSMNIFSHFPTNSLRTLHLLARLPHASVSKQRCLFLPDHQLLLGPEGEKNGAGASRPQLHLIINQINPLHEL